VGLIARQVEAAGISTLCMGSALDILKAGNPPRAAFLDYPLGHTTGKPNQPELQREILIQALEGFTSLIVPGSIKMLPFRWDDEDWKRTAMSEGDSRTPRYDTPQYQTEEDRIRAEANAAVSCEVCEVPA
jgi:D-proline reductase (dithiol) PrdB